LYAFLTFISFLEAIICFTLISASTMRLREPVKKRVTVSIVMMTFIMSIFFYLLLIIGVDKVGNFAIVIILIEFFLWFFICSDDTFFVSVFNLLTFINIYVSISYMSDRLASNLAGVPYMILYITTRTVIYTVIIPLLYKFVRIPFRRLVDVLDKEWHVASLVPLIFLVLQIFLLYYPAPYWNWERNNWYNYITITVYILFLAVYYLLYVQANAIVEKYLLKGRELLMSQQNKLWESELVRQKASVALASQQRHDMHHHNYVIMNMLQNGDVEALKMYMKGYDNLLDVSNDNVFCINPIINSLLNIYSNRAKSEGIKISFNVSIPENIDIDNVDLTCIYGNALENALEGCLRLPKDDEKEITVTSKYIDYRLRLQIENTCSEDIIFNGELPVTQKQSGGTGTKSIIYTAERYDGTAGFSVKDGKFISQIVLNSRKNVLK